MNHICIRDKITKPNFKEASCVYKFMKTFMSYLFINILLYKVNNFNFKVFKKFQGFEIQIKINIKNEISIKMC